MTSSSTFYENKLRTRVCGLCFNEEKLLLVKHNLKGKTFYAPPGGGVEFGETMEEALNREIKEETELKVILTEFKFITEYIKRPIHAIEVFYWVKTYKGVASTGSDPESETQEVIEDVNWYSIDDIKRIKKEELHHVLHNCNNLRDILALSGYIPYPTF